MAGRDPHLPRLVRVASHPLVAHVEGVTDIFVYLHDTSDSAMADLYKFVTEQEFPPGTPQGIQDAGEPFQKRRNCNHSFHAIRICHLAPWRVCLRS